MENKHFGPFLTDEAVLAIACKRAIGSVSLAALDCNWTGQNKVQGEKDYFDIWAAVSFFDENDRVFLHGARFSNWNLEYEMNLVLTSENMGLYRLALDNPNEFPNEFVIRLVKETGEELYDNNNYRNYSIEHNNGHFATAIKRHSSIIVFDSITPIEIICSTP
jgi:hypothetical protein